MADKNWREQMKKDWTARAEDDARYWTLNCYEKYNVPEDDYLAGGESTMRETLDNWMHNMAVVTDDMDCFEIGCGAGRLTYQLSKRFKSVTACDIAPGMVAATEKLMKSKGVKNVVVFEADGDAFPQVGSASHDFVYSCIVFQHIPDPAIQQQYIREIGRILKPGGLFLISLYGDVETYNELKFQWELRRKVNDLLGWSDAAREELPRYETGMSTAITDEQLDEAMQDGGLEKVFERGNGSSIWWVGGRKK